MVPPVPRPRPVAGSPWPGPRRRRWGRAVLSAVPPVSEPSASSWRLSASLLPDAGPCTRSPGVTVTSLCRPQSSSSPRRAAYAARLPPGHPHDLRSPQLPQQERSGGPLLCSGTSPSLSVVPRGSDPSFRGGVPAGSSVPPGAHPGKPSSLLGSPLPAGSAAPLPGKGHVCSASCGRPDRTTAGCGSDDRCESFPVLEQRQGRARPSGGAEKALSPRPAPGGLAHSLACGLTLLVSARLHLASSSSSSVLPRGPGICPLTPWLLPGGDLLLCLPA